MNPAVCIDRWLTRPIAFAQRHTESAAFGVAGFWLLVSLALPWIDSPLGKDPRGIQFALFEDVAILPHFRFASYGMIGVAIFVLSWIAVRADRRAAACGGLALLALVIAAPLQIGFSNPGILHRLASEFDQHQKVSGFTANFLPVNQGGPPEVWTSLDFSTLWTRFVSAWYFLTLGWYVFTLAAVIVFFKGISLLQSGHLRVLFASALALLCFTALFLARPFYAHAQLDRAYLAQASGGASEAIGLYRATMRLDRWYALGPELYSQIGELHESLGVLDSPEHHLYKGQLYENQASLPSAIYEYRLAASGGGDLEIVAHREAARVAANLGLSLYRAQAYGAALAQWQQAFEEDPLQLQTLFYAARGHYELAQYGEAIAAGEAFCKRASNPIVMADVYSDMGDSYSELNDHPHARACYELSFKLDYTLNARGLARLRAFENASTDAAVPLDA